MESDTIPTRMFVDRESETLEGVPIRDLLNSFGSPLFVVSERIIEKKYNDLKAALGSMYSHHRIAYSFKTNYVSGICRIMKDLGAYAEVVSGFEYWLAKRIGYDDSEIIFNGPRKTKEDLKRYAFGSGILNIDNNEELRILADIAGENKKEIRAGVRVNVFGESGRPNLWNRFGFNIETGAAYDFIARAESLGGRIRIAGVHMHLGTNIYASAQYSHAVQKVVKFAKEVRERFGILFEYVDVGGGFAVPDMRLAGVKDWNPPTVSHYIEAIVTPLNEGLGYKPLLIVEPGRYLIAEAVVHLATVLSSRVVGDAKFVTVDSSNILLREGSHIELTVEPVKSHSTSERAVVCGGSCANTDILGTANVQGLEVGDIIMVHSAGAYSISRSGQWVSPRPAVVSIMKNGEVLLFRSAEKSEDLVSHDI